MSKHEGKMEQYFEKFSNRLWKPLEVTNCGIQQTKLKNLVCNSMQCGVLDPVKS